MKIRLFFMLILAFFMILSSCEEKGILIIDAELQPYFEAFQEEGALRGVDIDFEEMRIEGKLEVLEGIGGQCEHNTVDPDVVFIDLTYWTQATEWEKEFIVFHELGHCALNRSHLDSREANGNCVSIMHSGSAGCASIYNSDTREDYLEELFQ